MKKFMMLVLGLVAFGAKKLEASDSAEDLIKKITDLHEQCEDIDAPEIAKMNLAAKAIEQRRAQAKAIKAKLVALKRLQKLEKQKFAIYGLEKRLTIRIGRRSEMGLDEVINAEEFQNFIASKAQAKAQVELEEAQKMIVEFQQKYSQNKTK